MVDNNKQYQLQQEAQAKVELARSQREKVVQDIQNFVESEKIKALDHYDYLVYLLKENDMAPTEAEIIEGLAGVTLWEYLERLSTKETKVILKVFGATLQVASDQLTRKDGVRLLRDTADSALADLAKAV